MISEPNKTRARNHLGYGAVQQSATFQLGVPAAMQTAFMIEGAWARILPSSEGLFINLLDRLDLIEEQLVENQGNLAVEGLGEIKVNLKEFEMLLMRYRHWQGSVANMLQVPPNPFDQRPFLGMGYNGGSGMNASVHH
jgi:hypothetical protein